MVIIPSLEGHWSKFAISSLILELGWPSVPKKNEASCNTYMEKTLTNPNFLETKIARENWAILQAYSLT